MMSTQNRRRHYFINKPLQSRYVLYIIMTLLVVSASGIVGTYYGIWASVIDGFSSQSVKEMLDTASQIQDYQDARRAKSPDLSNSSLRLFREIDLLSDRQKDLIQQILDDTRARLIRLGFILILLIGWASIFLTHKIAGPLYRLRRSCREIGEGDLMTRIQFRKYDEAHDVARDFNQMAAGLDATLSTVKRMVNDMPYNPKVDELKKALGRFRTSSD